MQYIALNIPCDAIFPIAESSNTDVVVYRLFKKDGTVLATGNATFVSGISWKVTFTPIILGETYILEVKNETLDVIYTDYFRAVSSSNLSSGVETDEDDPPTAQELLTIVDKAIRKRLTGGGISSYEIKGRNISYMSLDELRAFRKELQKEVQMNVSTGRNYASF